MKIFIGTDHAGFELKGNILDNLQKNGLDITDKGPFEFDAADDYPDFAFSVAKAVSEDPENNRGILICTSGQGMAMAANRVKNVRTALVWDKESAIHSRQHNNANIISLPGKRLSFDEIIDILQTWLNEPFTKEERHQRRINKIEEMTETCQ
jgi:ribose 5-phosphate isomerase B